MKIHSQLFAVLSLLTLDEVKKVNFEEKGDHFFKETVNLTYFYKFLGKIMINLFCIRVRILFSTIILQIL